MHLAQDRDQWWAVGNTVMNFWDSIKGGEFLDLVSDCELLKDCAGIRSLVS